MSVSFQKLPLVVCMFLGVSLQAQAASFFTCNNKTIKRSSVNVTYKASLTGFVPDTPWSTTLINALDKVNQNPSKIRGAIQWNDPVVALNNGENEIWWASNITAPADAPQQWNCLTGNLVSSDIRINNAASNQWTSKSTDKTINLSYAGTLRPLENTLIHEFGHTLGLSHSADIQSIMGSDYNFVHANGSLLRPYLGPDASSGLKQLYGAKAYSDLSVSHWKRTGFSGEYTTHGRTAIYSVDGLLLPSSLIKGEPVYSATKGQTLQVEFTYENNGDQASLFDMDFLISTDDTIDALDLDIGGRTDISLPATYTWTKTFPVTLPTNLISGTVYYVGVKIDSSNEHVEFTEENNATYMAIRIL